MRSTFTATTWARTAGGSVEFNVPATIEGVLEVELESRAEQLASITVNP